MDEPRVLDDGISLERHLKKLIKNGCALRSDARALLPLRPALLVEEGLHRLKQL
jgi:hypothetical protein